MTRPSSIPQGGRSLLPGELEALQQDMAVIVTQSHLFKSLDDDGRADVLESGYVQSFAAGDVVITEGRPGAVIYLVMAGKVKIETSTPAGVVYLAELGRGACVGEVSVLTGGLRTATVTAVDDVDVVAFATHRIERVLTRYPQVRAVLEKLVESRARDTIDKIIG